ncbi:DMT family transporter [Hydromonas duriensis]|uniref:EamA-like transporter family protein n=1 Tax=Hydromonas duriensis TaxID=1527608 RepID=A0A4R6Y6N8_9BURK|nr:DMT family transporter [Hydromonas duriensis]TDR30822.1 EamA-like transporter family protein [Hydromonas duriensis]
MFSLSKKSLSVLALLEVSIFWGLCWMGYRQLYSLGMSAMGAAVSTSLVATVVSGLLAKRALCAGEWRETPPSRLAMLMLSSAVGALGFTWGMVHGEVMRVMLLFYLMPVWTVILAHFVVKEKTNWAGWLGTGMGLMGAAFMLYDSKLGLPFPSSTAEWAGLTAGIGAGALNILVKQTPNIRADSLTFFLSLGGLILGLFLVCFEQGSHLPSSGNVWSAVFITMLMGCLLLLTNRMYQFGVKHLTSHQVVVILPFELVIGAVSSWLLAGELLSERALLGGVLILGAGMVSAWWSE